MAQQKDTQLLVPDEVIISKIYFIRGKKVMIDRDMAELQNSQAILDNQ